MHLSDLFSFAEPLLCDPVGEELICRSNAAIFVRCGNTCRIQVCVSNMGNADDRLNADISRLVARYLVSHIGRPWSVLPITRLRS